VAAATDAQAESAKSASEIIASLLANPDAAIACFVAGTSTGKAACLTVGTGFLLWAPPWYRSPMAFKALHK
jgi:hypothetical protein